MRLRLVLPMAALGIGLLISGGRESSAERLNVGYEYACLNTEYENVSVKTGQINETMSIGNDGARILEKKDTRTGVYKTKHQKKMYSYYGWYYTEVTDYCYLVNGEVQYDYSGMIKANGTYYMISMGSLQSSWNGSYYADDMNLYYFKNGILDKKFSGFDDNGYLYSKGICKRTGSTQRKLVKTTFKNETTWWLMQDNMILRCDDIVKNENGWWKVSDGKVDFTYTGFAENANGTWYVENGRITFKKNDVIKGRVNGIDGWWCVKNSKVQFIDSVEKNKNGWWKITNGMVDFYYTGMAKNSNGWWRIENGKVNFNATGICKNENGWFYCKNGKVDFGFNGIAKVNEKYHSTNEIGSWAYCKNGKWYKSYSGLATNSNGTWWVDEGKITFNTAGMYISGKKRYLVIGSKVQKVYDDSKMSDAEWKDMQQTPKVGNLGKKATIEETEAMYIQYVIKRAKYYAPMYAAEFAARGLAYDEDFAIIMAMAKTVETYYWQCEYQSDYDRSTYYNRPYGIFYTGHTTCSGAAESETQALLALGYKDAVHTNKDLYTHQWANFYYKGRYAFADGGIAWFEDDYEEDPWGGKVVMYKADGGCKLLKDSK